MNRRTTAWLLAATFTTSGVVLLPRPAAAQRRSVGGALRGLQGGRGGARTPNPGRNRLQNPGRGGRVRPPGGIDRPVGGVGRGGRRGGGIGRGVIDPSRQWAGPGRGMRDGLWDGGRGARRRADRGWRDQWPGPEGRRGRDDWWRWAGGNWGAPGNWGGPGNWGAPGNWGPPPANWGQPIPPVIPNGGWGGNYYPPRNNGGGFNVGAFLIGAALTYGAYRLYNEKKQEDRSRDE